MSVPRRATQVVDSSALAAVLFEEEQADAVSAQLDRGHNVMSTATYVECALVVDNRLGIPGRAMLDRLVASSDVELVSFDVSQALAARQAHHRFGRGSGSPARLNLGDCYSYALAATLSAPLLYVGDDFTHTDLTSALPR